MWLLPLLTVAHAQDCAIRTAVGGFPLGDVPTEALSTVVVEAGCALTAEATVYGPDGIVYATSLTPTFDGPFQFFRFHTEAPPFHEDLRFDVGLQIDGELVRYIAGWYRVDPALTASLDGVPELADVVVEPLGDQIAISAAVLPATTAPEAMFLWRLDGVLHEVTVSTQPRPTLVTHATGAPICLEVEEIGVDGARATSEPRCVEPEALGCGCRTGRAGLVGWGLRR